MSRTPGESRQATLHDRDWYARRDGVVRGPFSGATVSRHILLGRIRIDDELSTDCHDWVRAGQVPGIVPSVMVRFANLADSRAYHQARMLADERRGERRRVACAGCGRCPGAERRVLPDRRKARALPVAAPLRSRPRAGSRAAADRIRYLVFALAAVLLLILMVPASH